MAPLGPVEPRHQSSQLARCLSLADAASTEGGDSIAMWLLQKRRETERLSAFTVLRMLHSLMRMRLTFLV